jgi:prepilin-type N-terminal cleavage/methylation domain-containing protein
MRSAFTLVEVLAAVAIATIAGAAMLKMNSSNLFFLGQLKQTSQVSEDLAVAALHADKRFNRNDESLFDLMGDTYAIDNDDLRRYLKAQNYRYSETVADTISFGTGMLTGSEEDDNGNEAANVEAAAAVPMIQFELISITLASDKRHGSIMQIRPMTE